MGKETAEQKLLKLIEKTDAQDTASGATPAPQANAEAMRVYDSVRGVGSSGLPILPVVANFLATLKRWFSGGGTTAGFGLREINRILALGVVVAMAFFFLNFSQGIGQMEDDAHLSLKDRAEKLPEAIDDLSSLLPSFKVLQDYVSVVSRRNIFQPFERKLVQDETEKMQEELGISRVSAQTKDLKLVGISWLDSPESASALVENTISGVTYFLKQGEKVNDVTIKNIYAESVVVAYQGEEMEMKL